MNDYVPHPHEAYDPHWVIKRDIGNIIQKYTARGDMDTVAVYQNYLAEKYSDSGS